MKEVLTQFFGNLFAIEYGNTQMLLERILWLILIFVVLFWLLYWVFAKVLYRNQEDDTNRPLHRDFAQSYVWLWSLIGLMLVFNLYWGILIYQNKLTAFKISEINFWYSMSGLLSLFVAIIIFFSVRYRRFLNTLKK